MLSITKINSGANQAKRNSNGKGYLHYLGGPATSTRQRGDFDDYARGNDAAAGPAPFWACKGPEMLGLGALADAESVERLAKGFHPFTGEPLVRGAGDAHVMGLDMTFSAPKDVSAIFAGADQATRDAVVACVQQAARRALGYAEANTITRHGHAGKIKQAAEAAIAACYTHFSSRAGEPQLHVHSFLFNLGKRKGSEEWSAIEQRSQFERKMATGILFRVELASKLRGLGFAVEPAGPYFTIRGIDESQRLALSTRSRQIAEYMRECGMLESDGAVAKEIAALNTRSAKAEPPLGELLRNFEKMAAELGLDQAAISAMRTGATPVQGDQPFAVDHAEILTTLMERQSCATAQEALAVICERAMGRWNADECLAELDRFLANENVVAMAPTERLTQAFTSKSTLAMESSISDSVAAGGADTKHRVAANFVDAEFDRLEAELRSKLGVEVSLGQQRHAAMHVANQTGRHAFVEGWAGTGKTTMLKALGVAYKAAGFEVRGCCQSAAASLNLTRETDIPSRTIASLLLALQSGRAKLGPRTVLIVDEAGMVGSREFGLIQKAAMEAGAKLVSVGDAKQLQPIEAGGIFRSLTERHGKAEISNIQRQRTDFAPLLKWLVERKALDASQAVALRRAPEEARIQALEAICSADGKLRRAFCRWQSRYDYEWMRGAVELFAKGDAAAALRMVDARGRLKLISGHTATMGKLISDWSVDKTPIERKTMIAATRAEVGELNDHARALFVEKGLIDDAAGMDIEITRRDETTDTKRFAPGDRIVFTQNDKQIGVSNGVAGSILAIERREFADLLVVRLDDGNERGEDLVRVPVSFSRFDHAYCLTNHKSQGRTFDAAYVLGNPGMADREWTYVAASRSRFATTIYANLGALGIQDPESHEARDEEPATRESAILALSKQMQRSRAKGTTLDYEDAPAISSDSAIEFDYRPRVVSAARDRLAAALDRLKAYGELLKNRGQSRRAATLAPEAPDLMPSPVAEDSSGGLGIDGLERVAER